MKNKNKKIHTKQKTKKVSLSDKAANFLFCEIIDFLIKEYENSFNAGRKGDNSRRDRKLLLHKIEIEKIKKKIEQDRLTIVPTKAYFSGSNLKVEIAIGRGKKLYDKRESLKKKDIDKKLKRIEI